MLTLSGSYPVPHRHQQGEIAGVEDQGRADDISMVGIASSATSSFDLDDYSQRVMERVEAGRVAHVPQVHAVGERSPSTRA